MIGFTAETEVNRKEWGLNWNVALEAGGVLVGEKISLVIDAEASSSKRQFLVAARAQPALTDGPRCAVTTLDMDPVESKICSRR